MTHDPAVHQRARVSLPTQLGSRPSVYYGARSYIISLGAVKKIQSQTASVCLTRPLRPPLTTRL